MEATEVILVLEEVAAQLGVAIDWGSKEVYPLVLAALKDYASRKSIEAFAQMIFSLIIGLVCYYLVVKIYNYVNNNYPDLDDMGIVCFLAIVAFSGGAIISSLFAFFLFHDWVSWISLGEYRAAESLVNMLT